MLRMTQDRQRGWQNLMINLQDPEPNNAVAPTPVLLPHKLEPSNNNNSPVSGRESAASKPSPIVEGKGGNYDFYHDQLDQHAQRMVEGERRMYEWRLGTLSKIHFAVGDHMAKQNPHVQIIQQPVIANHNRPSPVVNVGRTPIPIKNEYLENKRQAQLNKARGQGILGGGAAAALKPNQPNVNKFAEMNQNLEQIRRKNLIDRRDVKKSSAYDNVKSPQKPPIIKPGTPVDERYRSAYDRDAVTEAEKKKAQEALQKIEPVNNNLTEVIINLQNIGAKPKNVDKKAYLQQLNKKWNEQGGPQQRQQWTDHTAD
ncbi:unnamed protein product, partial [Didymodactylos carnosus]